MPYRIDLRNAGDAALDQLVEMGALDVESSPSGLAALMPDSIPADEVSRVLGMAHVAVSPAVGRDAGSVWILSPRPIRIGSLRIVPAHLEPEAGALRLIDAAAFGTGLHPTTALCLEALDDAVRVSTPHAVLVLSGIRASLEPDVVRAYRDVGMRCLDVKSRDRWVALVLRSSW